MLSEKNKLQLKEKGITEIELNEQLDRFRKGFPYLNIADAAKVDKGILKLSDADKKKYENVWTDYIKGEQKVIKFVPASGAASRMFKDLFSFLDASYNVPTTEFEKKFFDNIQEFAFYESLNKICLKNEGKSIEELMKHGSYKAIVENFLLPKGLDYGNLPKGLLEFHKYTDSVRTPVEEHLVEGALYATNASRVVNLHFTISTEHKDLFVSLIKDKQPIYENKYNVKYNIGFSEQKSSTDTVAVNPDNSLFDDDGSILFRPGGHGALIENLNDIDADVIFIKNIDNTIPDKRKEIETQYKKILAGVLVEKQNKAFQYLKLLDEGVYSHDQLVEILYFLQKELNIKNPETKLLEDVELVLYMKGKLNRPMRVCGMVRNVGEPGGGPFLAENSDKTISPQILEESQIDISNERNKEVVDRSTHFNPVDLVCAVKSCKGEKFNLPNYVDRNTGFISSKSKGGRSLRALELPGLWNGAMSDWNTIFVEVPIETFNPVKTVNDLLRSEHLL